MFWDGFKIFLIGMGVICAAYIVIMTGISHQNEYVWKIDPKRPIVYEDANGNEAVTCPSCNRVTLKEKLSLKVNDNQEIEVRCPRCRQVLDMSIGDSAIAEKTENTVEEQPKTTGSSADVKEPENTAKDPNAVVVEDASGNEFVLCQDCNKLSSKKDLYIEIGDDQKLIVSCPHCKQVLGVPVDNSMLNRAQ